MARDKYLSKENTKDINKIIAYHWKKENFEDYNLFVKISYITKSKWLIGLMVVLILSLGVISGIGGNYITEKLFNGFSNVNITKEAKVSVNKGNKNATNKRN